MITVAATLPYLVDIVRGNAKPRLVTWFIWAVLAGIGSAASFADHQIPAGVFILTTCLESATVVVLGFKNGDRSLEKLDIFCLVGALTGLGIWFFLKSPALAVMVTILIDSTATVPTVKHCWLRPYEETWITYAMFILATTMLLFITNFRVFTGFAYPVFYLFEDSLLTGLILFSPPEPTAFGCGLIPGSTGLFKTIQTKDVVWAPSRRPAPLY